MSGRRGLLAAFVISMVLGSYYFFYSDISVRRKIQARLVRGQESFGLLKAIESICASLRTRPPEIYLTTDPDITTYSFAKGWQHRHLVVNEDLLRKLPPVQRRALIGLAITHADSLDRPLVWLTLLIARALESFAALLDFVLTGNKFSFFRGRVFYPISRSLLSAAHGSQRIFNADKRATKITDKKDLAAVLWQLDGYTRTHPKEFAPTVAAHFVLNPLTVPKKTRYFYREAQPDERIRQLVGQFPV